MKTMVGRVRRIIPEIDWILIVGLAVAMVIVLLLTFEVWAPHAVRH